MSRFICEHCGDGFDSVEGRYITANGDDICSDCYENDYFTCQECGDIYYNDDYGGDDCCEDCYSNQGDGDTIDKPLTFEEDGKEGEIIKIDRFVGVEIEAESDGRIRTDLTPDYVNVKYDGSLSGGGREFVTHPRKQKLLEDLIKESCKAISNMDYYVNTSCGLHVHLDCRDIKNNEEEQDKIALAYILFEPVIMSMLPSSRRSNSYCQSLRESYNVPTKLLEDSIKKNLKVKSKKFEGSRYKAVNFQALSKYGTVEIRSHSGTIDSNKIIQWINLHLSIFEFAKTMSLQNIAYYLRARKLESRASRMAELLKLSSNSKKYILARIARFK